MTTSTTTTTTLNKQKIVPKTSNEKAIRLFDLKNAIPKHCFERSYLKSFTHLGIDLLEIVVLGGAMLYFLKHYSSSVSTPTNILVQLVYSALQGVFFTAVWVLAHECGHGAFAPSQLVNDIVGFIFHSMMYVPYFAWQFTHASHHHYTSHMDKDEVWVPSREIIKPVGTKTSEKSQLQETKEEHSHFYVWYMIFVMLTAGWPMYIFTNATGHMTQDSANHFNPNSSIFDNMKKSDKWKIHLGTAGIVAWTLFLIASPFLFSGFTFMMLVRLYVLPMCVNFFFLTSITYLQHTDPKLPHFESSEWDWLRGATTTIDRDMGTFLNWQLHDIHHTHVCHHIFSKLPFYNSREATVHIKRVLGDSYQYEEENYFISLYKNLKACRTLQETEPGVLWWL